MHMEEWDEKKTAPQQFWLALGVQMVRDDSRVIIRKTASALLLISWLSDIILSILLVTAGRGDL